MCRIFLNSIRQICVYSFEIFYVVISKIFSPVEHTLYFEYLGLGNKFYDEKVIQKLHIDWWIFIYLF